MNLKNIKTKNRNNINYYLQGNEHGIASFYPNYIQLEHTNKCNAQCIMCNHFYLQNNGSDDINTVVVDKLLKIMPYCDVLMLNGDGEPFLCKNIGELIKTYVKYDVKIGTNTNLCYIPDDCWSLFKTSFGFLNISCDGASAATFELIRKGLSFEVFTQNLRSLNKIAPDLHKNLDCVVMRQNIAEMPELVRFAAENGFSSVRFHRLGVNPCIGNEADSDVHFLKYAIEKSKQAKEISEKLKICISVPEYSADDSEYKEFRTESINTLRNEVTIRQKKAQDMYGHLSLETDYFSEQVTIRELSEDLWYVGKPCRWALERCYVDLKGNVSTCCYSMKKNMGNLLKNTFEEIWNGELYIKFRKIMSSGYLPSWCKDCNWIKDSKF